MKPTKLVLVIAGLTVCLVTLINTVFSHRTSPVSQRDITDSALERQLRLADARADAAERRVEKLEAERETEKAQAKNEPDSESGGEVDTPTRPPTAREPKPAPVPEPEEEVEEDEQVPPGFLGAWKGVYELAYRNPSNLHSIAFKEHGSLILRGLNGQVLKGRWTAEGQIVRLKYKDGSKTLDRRFKWRYGGNDTVLILQSVTPEDLTFGDEMYFNRG